jgi:glycosyltransferase involved in cell wall biosynthesis/GT2 family glycosyltransferase
MPRASGEERVSAEPRISVVISAYTEERLDALHGAIESVRSQIRPAHETILVIDHAPELLAKAEERWPEVRIISNQEAQGLSGARNSGIAVSGGDVVAFLDDDAFAGSDWLERMAAAYSDPKVLGVGGLIRPRWIEGRPRWFPVEFDWVVGCSHSGMPSEPAPVRNLIGANMSFRREVLLEVGGFRHQLSRIGKNPVGGEETDICIRIGERRPDGVILYDPAVAVDHLVPAARGRFSYFRQRCAAEGRSKAVLSGLVGSRSGLRTERTYVRRTLPLGFLRGFGEALRGDPAGLARSGALVAGLLTTTSGYLSERRQLGGVPSPNVAGSGDGGDELRILMVTPRSPLGQGGVERHVMEVSRRVASAGVEVEVLCAEPGARGSTEQSRDGVTIRSVPAWPAKRDYYLAPGIWREMGRRPRSLVHVQSYHTLVAPLAMLRALVLRVPYVVTFHGGGHSSGARNRLRRLQRRLLRPLLARASRLVAVARFEIDLYSRELRIPRERFVLIPNGTDLPAAGLDGAESAGQPGLLASIGRLERYKGHQRVIAALPRVLEREPDARLLVVGTGPYEPELRRKAADLGVEDRVEFTSIPAGDREGMASLLQRVSLVVLLSDFETHPLVALEAAAAGRKLLVANGSGLGELADEGLARSLPPESEPGAVGDAIVEELGRPSRQRTLRLTTWDECAAALLDLYRLLGVPARR